MKSNGAIDMFSNLSERYDLRYVYFNRDGDTEWYKKEVAEKLYGNFTPQKLECVKYVQKRLRTRLRKLRNEKKYEVLSGGKKTLRKRRLTDKIISKMQSFYGVAICQNLGRFHAMKKRIGTVF